MLLNYRLLFGPWARIQTMEECLDYAKISMTSETVSLDAAIRVVDTSGTPGMGAFTFTCERYRGNI